MVPVLREAGFAPFGERAVIVKSPMSVNRKDGIIAR
jgi:hypothetical protein